MKNQASQWLIKKRKELNLSLRQLGAKTDLSHVTISNAEDGNATTDTWIKLAEFFEEDTQTVLSWAGVVPQVPDADEWVTAMQHKLQRLSPDLRDIAENFIEVLRKRESKK